MLRKNFAIMVETLRSTYEARKNKLTGFERAYVNAWMKHWLNHMINHGVIVEKPYLQHTTNWRSIALRRRFTKRAQAVA